MNCKECGKPSILAVRYISECDTCEEPVCEKCAEYDYDMVGDPPHYVCCQWICKPCLRGNDNDSSK